MIYLIRHGQTALNKQRVLQGRSDQPLNEVGIREAEAAAAWFREQEIRFDAIISSPLQRAVRTAQIVAGIGEPEAEAQEEGIPIRTDERLLEMDYGPYEGRSLTDPSPELLAFFQDFVNNPEPEGMEPLEHVVQRLGDFMEDLKRDLPEGNVLIATHAIAMKGALEYLTPGSDGAYWGKHIRNCEVYAMDLQEDGFSVPEALSIPLP